MVIKYNIAVVDDDYRILQSLESLLESAGHEVHLFHSAEDFLKSRILADIDCLISDIGMPRVDGFELLRLSQAVRPGLVVILITGHEEITKIGCPAVIPYNRFFVKPFDGKQLLHAIESALRNIAE